MAEAPLDGSKGPEGRTAVCEIGSAEGVADKLGTEDSDEILLLEGA